MRMLLFEVRGRARPRAVKTRHAQVQLIDKCAENGTERGECILLKCTSVEANFELCMW